MRRLHEAVHRTLLLLAVLGMLGCATPEAPTGSGTSQLEDDRDARTVFEAHEKLVRAYERGDAEAITDLLAADAAMHLFHPRVFNRFDDAEEVREGLRAMYARLGENSWSDVHPMVRVEGDVAWFTSHLVIEADALDKPFVGRGTEIWLRLPEGWRLTHAHWSADPEY